MRAGLLVIGLGEFPDQFFKDIAHVGGGDLLWGHIGLCRVELLQSHKQHTALDHQLDCIGKVEILNDVLDIGGKAPQIGFKIRFYIVRV